MHTNQERFQCERPREKKAVQTERTGSRPTFFNSTHLPQTLILNQIKLIFVPPHFALAPLKQRLKNRIVTLVCHCLPGLVPACLDMLCRPTLSAQGFRSLRSVVQGLLYPPPACNSTTSSRHSCAFLMVVPLGAPLTSDNPLSGEYSYLILKWFIWTRWIWERLPSEYSSWRNAIYNFVMNERMNEWMKEYVSAYIRTYIGLGLHSA